MPELPEVETRVRELRQPCVGRTICGVQLDWPRHLHQLSPQQFAERIHGQTVTQLWRRGKYLIFDLTRDALLIHLRMSGDLCVQPANIAAEPHTHTRLRRRSCCRWRTPACTHKLALCGSTLSPFGKM